MCKHPNAGLEIESVNTEGPPIGHWLKDLAHYIVLERITYSIKTILYIYI